VPSSWPIAPLSPPWLTIVGGLGGAPALVVTCDPGRVTFCVPPVPVTDMLLPNRKVEVVLFGWTSSTQMPPRMPIVLEGVVMVIGLVLLILPPTKRSTPLVALTASSPVLVAGS
jgi:hypothetical protein